MTKLFLWPRGRPRILPFDWSAYCLPLMKTPHKTAVSTGRISVTNLTLGDLIASTYNACGDRAPRLLQLALESQLVRLRRAPSH
jgi:hypothetical protein